MSLHDSLHESSETGVDSAHVDGRDTTQDTIPRYEGSTREIDTIIDTVDDTPPFFTDNVRFVYTLVTYVIVGVVSCVMRLVRSDISDNGAPIFDEKHYATQSTQMLFNGMIENNPGYGLVVHPSLSKMIMSVGEKIFGYTPYGWRFTGIIAGVAIVLLLCTIVHVMTRSLSLVAVTGVVANIEMVDLIMSRMSMLDIYQTLFIVVMALCCVMYIRSNYESRGVPWLKRYWLYGIGVSGGLALCVKISGLYYLFATGVILVAYTLINTTHYTPRWSRGRIAHATRGTLYGLWCLLVVPLFLFITCFTPWFTEETSWGSNAINQGTSKIDYPQWLIDIMPDKLLNFVAMHYDILTFHTSLTTSADYTHPWESKPWQWLVGDRPMLFLNSSINDGESIQQMWLVGNLCLWIMVTPLVIYGIYKMVRHDMRWSVAVGGFLIGFVPWLIGYERQMYMFYCTQLAPFVVLMWVFVIEDITHTLSRHDIRAVIRADDRAEEIGRLDVQKFAHGPSWRMYMLVSAVVFAPAVAFFVHYTPWVYATSLTPEQQQERVLFPTWDKIDNSKENYGIRSINIVSHFLGANDLPAVQHNDNDDGDDETQ